MALRITTWEDWPNLPTIDDPLAWQAKLDAAPASINTRGSGRFWKTVAERGLSVVYRDGSPDISEIVFDLGGGIGLQLKIEQETATHIDYRFVDLATYRGEWGWIDPVEKPTPASPCRQCRKFRAVKDGLCLLCLQTGER